MLSLVVAPGSLSRSLLLCSCATDGAWEMHPALQLTQSPFQPVVLQFTLCWIIQLGIPNIHFQTNCTNSVFPLVTYYSSMYGYFNKLLHLFPISLGKYHKMRGGSKPLHSNVPYCAKLKIIFSLNLLCDGFDPIHRNLQSLWLYGELQVSLLGNKSLIFIKMLCSPS